MNSPTRVARPIANQVMILPTAAPPERSCPSATACGDGVEPVRAVADGVGAAVPGPAPAEMPATSVTAVSAAAVPVTSVGASAGSPASGVFARGATRAGAVCDGEGADEGLGRSLKDSGGLPFVPSLISQISPAIARPQKTMPNSGPGPMPNSQPPLPRVMTKIRPSRTVPAITAMRRPSLTGSTGSEGSPPIGSITSRMR